MIHVAITRRVLPGHERQFEEKLKIFMQQAEERPETLGAFMLLPVGERKHEYGIVRAFRNREAEQAFYDSDLYRLWSETVQQHVEGDAQRRELHGLEGFFRQGGAPPPPKWKMALLTWLAVNPAVYVCSRGVPALLDGVPAYVQFPIVNAGVVTLLTWVLMPLLVGLSRPWLAPMRGVAIAARSNPNVHRND